ncbi:MAG: response regulator [Treponema sp.]|jgi:putative two-component system response regulator|nr:response regulator [Treponema sp.]
MPETNAPDTVLVVDDIELNLMILEEILQDTYKVISADNGIAALEVLHSVKPLPKLILLDLYMPRMDGLAMFELMKADEVLKRIPVIFITSSDSENKALSAGAVDFISKPFLPEIVKLRVQNQIKLKNYSDSLEEMVAKKAAELTATLDNVLQAMANIIEYRNFESGSHVKRTQFFSKALIDHIIANSLPYSKELRDMDPDIITKSVALHDVGKIGIPDKILLKPGKLDHDEFEVMKTHTTIGKQIIESVLSNTETAYLQHCRDICYCHHERFDGKGYPQGIAGTDIPLPARLLSLVDVYDALVSARVYKAAFSYSSAMQIIIDGRGSQFDPKLVDAVVMIQDEFEVISQHFR